MVKSTWLTIVTILFFISSFSTVNASLLSLNKDGSIEWKVLSATDENNSLNIPKPTSVEVNKVGEKEVGGDSQIVLAKSDNKLNLIVSSDGSKKELDVTTWKGDVVEIEERPEVQKIRISVVDGKFSLKQKGISATTDNQVTVDSKSAEFSIKTDSGNKFLSILPYDAVQNVLKTKVISETSENNIQILEENGNLAYKISGNKVINILDFYQYKIPVDSIVSASTGAILRIDSPTLYKYLNFWFT